MSDSLAEKELKITAVLSDDIVNKPTLQPQSKDNDNDFNNIPFIKIGRALTFCANEGKPATEWNYSLRNGLCLIINNINMKTEFLQKYMDKQLLGLRQFLENDAKFSSVKVYKKYAGDDFLGIFQNIADDPLFEYYDSFFCFIICDNCFTSETYNQVDIDKAMSFILTNKQFDQKPKLFFIQEPAENKCIEREIFNSTKGGNEFLVAYQKNTTVHFDGLIFRMLKAFQKCADQEDILTMLVNCSFFKYHCQVHNLSKPVVFANCYQDRNYTIQALRK